MRFRDEKPEDLERARAAVRQWRGGNPDSSVEEMLATLGPDFHKDYGPVLRALLFRADLRDAHVTTGVTILSTEDQ